MLAAQAVRALRLAAARGFTPLEVLVVTGEAGALAQAVDAKAVGLKKTRHHEKGVQGQLKGRQGVYTYSSHLLAREGLEATCQAAAGVAKRINKGQSSHPLRIRICLEKTKMAAMAA